MTIMSLHIQQNPKLHTVTITPLLYCSKLLGRVCVRRLEGGWRAAGGRDVSRAAALPW